MGNSSITLQQLVDDASSAADLAPALQVGGWSDSPALSIATDVMAAMCAGGPDGQPFPWKWNRFRVPTFCTISLQQDYASVALLNIGYIEHAFAVDINSTSTPKKVVKMEVKRDLEASSLQLGYPAKVCWLPNDQLDYGTWGQTQRASMRGLKNPGAGVVYVNPLGATTDPANPTTQIRDGNGNLWVLTTYGTCGMTEPTWTPTPAFPTYADPTIVADTVTDGTSVWTAINPAGQGFRLDPIPSATGIVWQINVIAQKKPVRFTTLGQTLDPLPDEMVHWFKQGFWAQCTRRNPEAKVRAKFPQEWALWLKALDNAVKSGNREQDDCMFYPESSIMDFRSSGGPVGPTYPWGY